MLTLEQINLLKAIDEYGSINTAAEKLFISKSGISTAIKSIEHKLGFSLLDRASYRAKLSYRAKMLLEKAEPLCRMQDDFQNFIKLLGENIESHIKLSWTLMYPLSKLNPVFKELADKFPQTKVILNHEVLSGERFLINGDVDLAIVETKTDTTNLEFKYLQKIKMPILISSLHPFLDLAPNEQNFSSLAKYPQIILKSNFDDTNAGGVYQGVHKWQVSDMSIKKDLISAGIGWGRLPEFLVKEELKQKTLIELKNIEDPINLKIYLAKRKNFSYGKVINYLWDII